MGDGFDAVFLTVNQIKMKISSPGIGSIVGAKSYRFAIEIVQLCQSLRKDNSWVFVNQLLRSGTSIGANVQESISAESKRDFVHKLSVALKEARETHYWLCLMHDSGIIEESAFNNLTNQVNQIIKMLTSIILNTKQKYHL